MYLSVIQTPVLWATKIFLSNFDLSSGKNIPTVCICLSFRPQSCGQSFFYENISTYLILNLTLHQARQNFTLAMWQLTEVMATLTMATDFIFLKLHNTQHLLLIVLFPVHPKNFRTTIFSTKLSGMRRYPRQCYSEFQYSFL